MAVKSNKPKIERKADYSNKLRKLIDEYSKILIVQADNVGSNQLQQIRHGLRGESVVLMGKNTLMKRSVKVHMEETGNRDIEPLLDLLKGNVGLLFTSGDLKEVREVISKFKVGAPARVGVVAPSDVTIPTGSTGLDPSQTAFFQALNIPTKINKGVVEILAPVEIIQKGEKVNSSQAMLLSKLGIKPFSYGLVVDKVYEDGTVYDPEILDLTEDDLAAKFAVGLSRVAAVALAISYPTIAAAPHMLINGYKNVLAVALATDYSFPLADKVKEFLEDPGKFLVAAAPVADAGGAAAAPKVEEKKEEPESSEEEGMLGLFDD